MKPLYILWGYDSCTSRVENIVALVRQLKKKLFYLHKIQKSKDYWEAKYKFVLLIGCFTMERLRIVNYKLSSLCGQEKKLSN